MNSVILTLEPAVGADRLFVKIAGESYELLQPATATAGQILRIEALRGQLAALKSDTVLSDEDADTFGDLLGRLVRILLPTADDDVHASLGDVHRLAIVSAYVEARTPKATTAAKPKRKGRRRR